MTINAGDIAGITIPLGMAFSLISSKKAKKAYRQRLANYQAGLAQLEPTAEESMIGKSLIDMAQNAIKGVEPLEVEIGRNATYLAQKAAMARNLQGRLRASAIEAARLGLSTGESFAAQTELNRQYQRDIDELTAQKAAEKAAALLRGREFGANILQGQQANLRQTQLAKAQMIAETPIYDESKAYGDIASSLFGLGGTALSEAIKIGE